MLSTADILTIRWPVAARAGPLVLEWTIELGATPRGRAVCVDAATGVVTPMQGDVALELEEREGLISLDAAGLLAVTVRREAQAGGETQLLYARTTLLTRLGAAGGQADTPVLERVRAGAGLMIA